MSDGEVLVEQRGDVLLLTLNRPDKLNAWHPGMGRTLMAAIEEANATTGADTITLQPGAGYTLAASPMTIPITTRLTIHGNNATIDGCRWRRK